MGFPHRESTSPDPRRVLEPELEKQRRRKIEQKETVLTKYALFLLRSSMGTPMPMPMPTQELKEFSFTRPLPFLHSPPRHPARAHSHFLHVGFSMGLGLSIHAARSAPLKLKDSKPLRCKSAAGRVLFPGAPALLQRRRGARGCCQSVVVAGGIISHLLLLLLLRRRRQQRRLVATPLLLLLLLEPREAFLCVHLDVRLRAAVEAHGLTAASA